MLTRKLAVWALAHGLCACSAPPSTNDNAFSTPLGGTTSSSGTFTMAMYAPESGVVQGLNTLGIVVADLHGSPVDGLAITLVPWMAAMGHGTSAIPQIEPLGSGRYVASDVTLFMPGDWQLRTTLATREQAVVTVTVP